MEKIAWITDSTCYLEPELLEKYNIHVVPLSVVFGDESLRENIEISAEEFYDRIKVSKNLPKTSQPSVGEFLELYEELKMKYDRGIAVHLSSGISGTYYTSQTAAELAGFELTAIDSEIATYPMSFMLLEGIKAQEEGKSYEEIVAHIERVKNDVRAYFLVDNLEHLHRGGRMNAAQFLVGSVLQIKPILHLHEKKIVAFEKIRTYKKAKNRIFDLFKEDAETGVPINAVVIHANHIEEAEAWKKELEAQYPNVSVKFSLFGPVVGTHVGQGTVGLSWYKNPTYSY